MATGRSGGWRAISMAKLLRDWDGTLARLVVPCHFDMFEFNTASTDEFTAECQRLGQPYKILENGEGYPLVGTRSTDVPPRP